MLPRASYKFGDTEKTNKSRKCPQQCRELKNFEKDLLEIVKNIKFRTTKDNFQGKLKRGIKAIRESPDVFIFGDKTSSRYKLKPAEHKKFFMNNITKTSQESAFGNYRHDQQRSEKHC